MKHYEIKDIGRNTILIPEKDKLIDTACWEGKIQLLMHETDSPLVERTFVVREIQHFIKLGGRIYEVFEE